MDSKTVWNDIYSKAVIPNENSTFSTFVSKYIRTEDCKGSEKRLLDIGCGNARDTHYFAKTFPNLKVEAVDGSDVIIQKNKTKYGDDIMFYASNVQNLGSLTMSKYDYIYCRFFIHSIPIIDYFVLIKWIYAHLKDNGYVFIECRSINDRMYGKGKKGKKKHEFINGHYRRFIDMKELLMNLYRNKFFLSYFQEADNLSVVGDDNPTLIRVVGQRVSDITPYKPSLDLLDMKNEYLKFIQGCNTNGIRIFPVCGSLLGVYRCNGIIPWDTDLDIGVLDEEVPKLLGFLRDNNYVMSSNGKQVHNNKTIYKITAVTEGNTSGDDYKKSSLFRYFDMTKELLWVRKNDMHLQLHIVYLDSTYKPPFWKSHHNEAFYTHVSKDFKSGYQKGRYNMPQSLFSPLKLSDIYGIPIYMPSNPEAILKKWYGDDCLTHYPQSLMGKNPDYNNTSLDETRFRTSRKRIETLFAL